MNNREYYERYGEMPWVKVAPNCPECGGELVLNGGDPTTGTPPGFECGGCMQWYGREQVQQIEREAEDAKA